MVEALSLFRVPVLHGNLNPNVYLLLFVVSGITIAVVSDSLILHVTHLLNWEKRGRGRGKALIRKYQGDPSPHPTTIALDKGG